MNNKRGIAQVFSPSSQDVDLRRATVFDVFEISRVLICSIRELCQIDHQDDPEKLNLWIANKDPATIQDRIVSGAELWVATKGAEVVAVGGLRDEGEVTLLYVDPDQSGCGFGSALLAGMEEVLRGRGCAEAHLRATKTALAFYHALGWRRDGVPTELHGIPQFPMRKSLHPSG
ncbi:putative acetyltransferase [Ruegeria halocynthiae]|uniref:Putative acetyltransferase n=1 Tax=Ruegeria halocynthiae TaxID=985054 RepID=A0A1H3FB23_9RHOB|nr:GNAT family N-acetyltransferase [Ruegeria halocynthiae]SDX88095.1 putative acetyltransferase [Ruegeria halocynthiae]